MDLFWSGRRTSASILYLANRYFARAVIHDRGAISTLCPSYPSILLVLNAVDLGLSLMAKFSKYDLDNTSLTVFAAPITAVLVSHFLLDLQGANRRQMKLGTEDAVQLSSVVQDDEDRPLSFAEEVSSFGSIVLTSEDATEELAASTEPDRPEDAPVAGHATDEAPDSPLTDG
ncbi:hypothetical protein C8T65DRAFT_244215 [Cerioporus squamosus]|nr:hypothetical protein C8T65DRAFT_244215 [Cerioporus squamosus]